MSSPRMLPVTFLTALRWFEVGLGPVWSVMIKIYTWFLQLLQFCSMAEPKPKHQSIQFKIWIHVTRYTLYTVESSQTLLYFCLGQPITNHLVFVAIYQGFKVVFLFPIGCHVIGLCFSMSGCWQSDKP